MLIPMLPLDVGTAIKVTDTLTQATMQGLRFQGCTIGIDASSGGSGHLSVLDSSAVDTPTFLAAATTTNLQGSLVLENVIVDSSVSAVSRSKILRSPDSDVLTRHQDSQNRDCHRPRWLDRDRNHLDSRQRL